MTVSVVVSLTLSKRVTRALRPSTSTCCLGSVRILGEVWRNSLPSGRDNARLSKLILDDILQDEHRVATTRSSLRHIHRGEPSPVRAQCGRSSNELMAIGCIRPQDWQAMEPLL